ncbi:glutamate receptor ionotropic, kainate 2-like [Gigantopelta aegis]|uniref:glutamate receptor ionotropic, kainate 2-like n=1 Tax=Gigantopelta aegis TaxID=1735272 RepID=UPI001B88CEA7|nr:glutamate receptor ionotropic, kainate 2-like [Gigantopelta aegis]
MMTTFVLLLLGVLLMVHQNEAVFHYYIQGSVMGRNQSSDTELYQEIADILLRENTRPNGTIAQNYCAIRFNTLNFDTSSGSAIHNSLVTARANFEDKGVAVAIGPYIDVFTSTNYVIINQLHMLTSPTGEDAEKMDPDWVLSILPEQASISAAVADIVNKLGWRNVALLSQDDFSPVLKLGHYNIQVWPIRLPTTIVSDKDQELQRNLIELRKSQKRKFILHSTKMDIIQHVMLAAKRLHLLHPSIDWFITYPDFEDVIGEREDSWPGSIYGIQLLRADKIPTNISHNAVIAERNISRLELGLAVDVVGLLRHVIYTVAQNCSKEPSVDYIVSAEQFDNIIKDQQSLTTLYDGALGQYMWHLENGSSRTNYTIDIMRMNAGLETIGTCKFVKGIPTLKFTKDIVQESSTTYTFSREEVLKVVTRQYDPFVMKIAGEYVGFNIDLLNELSKKLNFKYEIFDVSGWRLDQHRTYTDGMVQELINGNASIAVGALEITAEREELISFSFTILSTRASILTKKAKSTTNFFQFLGPFSTGLWLLILGFVAVAGGTLYAMNRFDQTQRGVEQKFDLKESIWYSLNVLLQGTTEYSPQTTSMRTLIAFFWFCVLVIDAAYTANLAAYLTLQQIDDRIKTIYDLADQTDLKYGVQKGSDLEEFIRTQSVDPFERMWAFMKLREEETLVSNMTLALENIKNGKFAFIGDHSTNEYYAKQQCGIESIEQNFGQKNFGLGFPRGAPYRDDINRALLELKEQGFIDHLKEKWWAEGQNCTDDTKTRRVSDKTTAELELTNMIGVFIVLAAFVVLAVIVEITERIVFCFDARRKKKRAQKEEPEKTQIDSFEGFRPPNETNENGPK